MTIREDINRRKRKVGIISYVGFGFFILGSFLGTVYREVILIGVLGFLVSFGGMIYLLWGIRCPSCRNYLGYAAALQSSPFSISRKIKFCPFCGIALDSEHQTT